MPYVAAGLILSFLFIFYPPQYDEVAWCTLEQPEPRLRAHFLHGQ